MNLEERIKSIKRGLTQLSAELQARESQGDLENIHELEAAVQVLEVVLQKLNSAHPEKAILRPAILESFSLDLRLRLTCLLENSCPL